MHIGTIQLLSPYIAPTKAALPPKECMEFGAKAAKNNNDNIHSNHL